MKPHGKSPNAEAALVQALRRWEGEGGALAHTMGSKLSSLFQGEVGDAADAEAADIIETLQELLAAEQASVRVAVLTAREVRGEARKLLLAFRRDNAWRCALLIRSLQRAGATPSTTIGVFYETAMAIRDPLVRLAFLNRGQCWLAHRLERLMPRVSGARLRIELGQMHSAYSESIKRTDLVLSNLRAATVPSGQV